MCNSCGKKRDNNGDARRQSNIQKKSCTFCGGEHQKEEIEPYTEPFPQLPPFPNGGICGMFPIPSTCKKEIMDHMVNFERKLIMEADRAKMRVKMMDYKRSGDEKARAEDPVEKVVGQLEQLDSDIQQLKHELAVEFLRKKYGTHDESCPCSQ